MLLETDIYLPNKIQISTVILSQRRGMYNYNEQTWVLYEVSDANTHAVAALILAIIFSTFQTMFGSMTEGSEMRGNCGTSML